MSETAPQRALSKVAVYAILERDGKYLLLQRQNAGYQDGNFGLPSGHVEQGELVSGAVRREVLEEIGITATKFEFADVAQRAGHGYIDFFFLVTEWNGTVTNMEPTLCAELSWHDPCQLPTNMIPFVRAVLQRISEGMQFSEYPSEPLS